MIQELHDLILRRALPDSDAQTIAKLKRKLKQEIEEGSVLESNMPHGCAGVDGLFGITLAGVII